MIDRQKGQIIFECDNCTETLETGTMDFDEANQKRREEGWGTIKTKDGVWEHYCPVDREKMRC